jgi:hypothetical protein
LFNTQKHLQGKTMSSISQQLEIWTTHFKSIFKQFYKIAEEVNLNLKSHHRKAGCNKKLAENPYTAGLPQVFHRIWELRASHPLFEYIVPSKSMLREIGKVVANWSATCRLGASKH